MSALSYRGPVVVPTPAEVALIRDALCGRRDPAARELIAKCDAALERRPKP